MYSKEVAHAGCQDRRGNGKAAGGARRKDRAHQDLYAREAILAHLDDLEDFYLAEERMCDFRAEDAIPLAELKRDLGLDD